MSEEDKFLKDLERLAERSKSSTSVDAAVDYTANSSARYSFSENLALLHNQIVDNYSKATQFWAPPVVVIRSHKGIIRPYNLVQEIEPSDDRLWNSINVYGPSGWTSIDGLYDRSLRFNEFEKRYNVLYTSLVKGMLDDCLGYSPEVLIHSIMGLSGELLPRLGIDPKKGETYMSLISAEKPTRKVNYKPLETTINQFVEAIFSPKQEGPTGPPLEVISHQPKEALPKAIIMGFTNSELGLSVEVMTEEQRVAMNITEEEGELIITDVAEGSPADKAGVKGCDSVLERGADKVPYGGDIVLGINGKAVKTIREFMQGFRQKQTVMLLRVYRSGSVLDLKINA